MPEELQIALKEIARCASKSSISLSGRVDREGLYVRGASALMYQGVLRPAGARIAVKTILSGTPLSKRDIIEEAVRRLHILSQVVHQNVLPLLGITTEFYFNISIVSAWMENGNAHDYVQEQSVDPRPLIDEIAQGLLYLHTYKQGPIAHGNLKGSNVLISPEGRALLTDFGLFPVLNSSLLVSLGMSHQHSINWMPPEYVDIGEVTTEGDVWAFAMTAFELFTRRVPFHDRGSMADTARAVIEGQLSRPALGDTYSRFTDGWWDLCCSCWNHDMLLRPPMIDVVEMVSLLLSGVSEISGPDSLPETTTFHARLTGNEITIPKQRPATVPSQYRTGRTLGSGNYSIVKEAIHVKTGQYYACKIINKKLLLEGREHMVRNEMAVLKRISSGHPNIVTLHDYFETRHNLYLCFDLCTGGNLFDSICARGQYTEADAAELVRTIFQAVKYIHGCDIVHRNLKPEKLLFRSKSEKTSEIMIVGFGLSRVMPDSKLNVLTEVCGNPGYMAPEIFKKTGHGKPVDVWAMGVITYFLLAGYTPFDRDTRTQEMSAIIAGDYRFEPEEYWANVSDTAKDFVRTCLTVDPDARPIAEQALQHPWLIAGVPPYVERDGQPADLLPHVRKAFDARKTFRKTVFGIIAIKRMATLASHLSPEHQKFSDELFKYKQESEKEVLEDMNIIHHNVEEPEQEHTSDLGAVGNISLKKDPVAAAAEAHVIPGSSSELNNSNDGGKDVSEKPASVALTAAAKKALHRLTRAGK